MALTGKLSITRFSRWGENLGRPSVTDAKHEEALDGTDKLTITCAEELSKGDRLVWFDRRGVCHEHIVDEPRRTHDESGAPYTVATCINSIAELWDDWVEDKVPSGTVAVALTAALQQTRWQVGTCDQPGSASRKLYHQSAREALADICETWGGEIETQITADGSGVASRKVGIRAARGNQSSPKRFTWTKDLVSIERAVGSDNPKTRVYGYGKGVETDGGGYGRRLTFGSVNGGRDYVEDATATRIWGHPDGRGGIIPAVGSYVNEQCEDARQLLAETKAYLKEACEPKITYTADVVDLYAFGRSWEGVEVGDKVAVIDKGFCDGGIRLTGRVSKIDRDLLTGETTVTFGNLTDSMADMWQSMTKALNASTSRSALYDAVAGASPGWLQLLQQSLNEQFNAAGTYHIETFELGEIWSNVPLDGATGLPVKTTSNMWAMNINGRGFRLASSLASDGQWDWRTFGTGDGFTADLINAGTLNANLIRAGLLTDAKGINRWDMESGEFALASTVKVGGKTVSAIAESAASSAVGDLDEELTQREIFNRLTNNGQTQGIYLSKGLLYVNAKYIKTGIISDALGRNTWNLGTGALTTNYMTANNVKASGTFECGTASNLLRLISGEIRGLEDGVQIGVIDFSAHMRNVSTGQLTTGLQLTGNNHIRITTPLISAAASSSESTTTTHAITKSCTLHFISQIDDLGDGRIQWWNSTRSINFIDGFCTVCNFD